MAGVEAEYGEVAGAAQVQREIIADPAETLTGYWFVVTRKSFRRKEEESSMLIDAAGEGSNSRGIQNCENVLSIFASI